MPYLVVTAIAAGIGIAVYFVSLRDGSMVRETPGEQPDAGPPAPRGSYVPVVPGANDWQSRITGLAGLIVAVIVGAALLAFTLYVSVSSVIRLFSGLTGGEASP
jgi:hypothetical protein